jgi:alkanesulfonate monooxygenase SsuD/methylene tetrahydromethanopterin reductase-like flavin-dependent oxidoreductase (luciferase family)
VARIFVIATENEGFVRAVARRAIAGYMTTPVYGPFQRWLGRGDALRPMQEAWDAGDRQKATELVPDDVIQDLFVMGTPQQCIDKIEAYAEAGVTVPVLAFLPTALDPKEMGARNIEVMRQLARG